jgi:hypothetical protein
MSGFFHSGTRQNRRRRGTPDRFAATNRFNIAQPDKLLRTAAIERAWMATAARAAQSGVRVC